MSAFLRGSVLILLGALGAAVLAYLYNPILIAPRLGPAGVADLGAFINLTSAFSFLSFPIELTLTRFVSRSNALNHPGQVSSLLRTTLKVILLYGTPAVCLTALFGPAITAYLQLNSSWPVRLALFFAYSALLLTSMQAGLQGLFRFGRYAFVYTFDPLTRLVVGSSFVFLGFGPLGAMAGYVGGYLAALLLAFWFLRAELSGTLVERVDTKDLIRYMGPVILYSVYLAYALSVDGLQAKHFLPAQDAGFYIAATTLAKILFAAVLPLSHMSFAIMADAYTRKTRLFPVLIKTWAWVGAMCVLAAGVGLSQSERVIRLTYGETFMPAAPLLAYAVFLFTPVALTIVFAHFSLARNNSSFLFGLAIGGALRILFMNLYHESSLALILASAGGAVVELLLCIIFAYTPMHMTGRIKKGGAGYPL